MATQKGSGLISRAVREALGTLVSPQICEQLITRSLAAHGLSSIPEAGSEVGNWLEAALRPEVELAVGPDAADLMMSQLGPIAAYAAISQPKAAPLAPAPAPVAPRPASSYPPIEAEPIEIDELEDFDLDDHPTNLPTNFRPDPPREPGWDQRPTLIGEEAKRDELLSGPPTVMFNSSEEVSFTPLPPVNPKVVSKPSPPARNRPSSEPPVMLYTARPQPMDKVLSEAPSPLPQVLTATHDQKDLAALRRYLSGTAKVKHIPDLVGLLDALEEPGLIEPIVLIDCQRPSVHITSVAALGEDLPRGTTIVLWGADDATWQQLDRDRTPSCRWVRCSSEATTDDVGSLCSMLLG